MQNLQEAKINDENTDMFCKFYSCNVCNLSPLLSLVKQDGNGASAFLLVITADELSITNDTIKLLVTLTHILFENKR